AILLGTVVPELRDEAKKLGDDLTELVRLRQAIETEKVTLAENTVKLAQERVKIQTLLESKRNTLAQTAQELDKVRRQAETLAKQTASLRELIAEMDKRIVARQIAPRSPVEADPRVALNDPGRIRPAMAFTDARGLLPHPVSGSALQNFGDIDGFGGKAQGIAYVTRQGAQVTSPTDGWVVYAGPFRSYGQLLIINPGNGYHVVLAGMQRIDVEFGQFVLAGEPVAIMGQNSTLAQSIVTAEPSNRPILYVEFRKEGTSIDPAPWWASDEEKVRG
ncbi:MAG: peptidoglycan DD-metalloendopeptidase family protein, partial [Fimbriimonadaceae bacterium]|nr:peptidoglycan DD-metalloendopeptidase family protein [Alphaproteobacteria bacterium]